MPHWRNARDKWLSAGDTQKLSEADSKLAEINADAVGLETTLHQRLAERRVNRVNLRREFFYATPTDVLQVLRELGLAKNVVDYVEEPEALEWRTSRRLSDGGSAGHDPDSAARSGRTAA